MFRWLRGKNMQIGVVVKLVIHCLAKIENDTGSALTAHQSKAGLNLRLSPRQHRTGIAAADSGNNRKIRVGTLMSWPI